jgi:uncharacterized protein YjbJ (UPF0337 family)
MTARRNLGQRIERFRAICPPVPSQGLGCSYKFAEPFCRNGSALECLECFSHTHQIELGPAGCRLVDVTFSNLARLLGAEYPRRVCMDKEHVKGAADKAKGAVKDAVGGLTGDRKLQAEGKMDKAKGAMHSAIGDVKDAVKDASK